MMHYVDARDSKVSSIINAAFPSYNGRKCKIQEFKGKRVNSYWDEGSISYYACVDLPSLKSIEFPKSSHPFFDKVGNQELRELPANVVLVQHSIVRGKDFGITIFAPDAMLTKLIPPPSDNVTECMKIVMGASSTWKNTYGGQTNIRFKNANEHRGITKAQWDEALNTCIDKGFMKKAGKGFKITNEGRNILGDYRVDRYPREVEVTEK